MPESSDLLGAIADLDDSYLKVMLLLAVRRARSEEPRRAGFWHALAVALADEQETRRSAAELRPGAATKAADTAVEGSDLDSVFDDLVAELTTLKAEIRESSGDLDTAGQEG
jgi:hypothetical protein